MYQVSVLPFALARAFLCGAWVQTCTRVGYTSKSPVSRTCLI